MPHELCLNHSDLTRAEHDNITFIVLQDTHRQQRFAPRFFRHAVRIVSRLRTEYRPAANPDRRPDASSPGSTGTLLPPRLLAAAANKAFALGRGGAGAPVVELHNDRLVQ